MFGFRKRKIALSQAPTTASELSTEGVRNDDNITTLLTKFYAKHPQKLVMNEILRQMSRDIEILKTTVSKLNEETATLKKQTDSKFEESDENLIELAQLYQRDVQYLKYRVVELLD